VRNLVASVLQVVGLVGLVAGGFLVSVAAGVVCASMAGFVVGLYLSDG